MPVQRTKQAVGGTRVDSVTRVLWLVLLAVASPVLLPVVIGAGLLYMVVDVLYGLALDKRRGDGMLMSFLAGLPRWYLAHIKWALLGDRDRPSIIPHGL